VRRLLFRANVVPSSLILFNLMMEALRSSVTSVLIRTIWRNIPEDGIFQIITVFTICRRICRSLYTHDTCSLERTYLCACVNLSDIYSPFSSSFKNSMGLTKGCTFMKDATAKIWYRCAKQSWCLKSYNSDDISLVRNVGFTYVLHVTTSWKFATFTTTAVRTSKSSDSVYLLNKIIQNVCVHSWTLCI
jgi:hypothetical protein